MRTAIIIVLTLTLAVTAAQARPLPLHRGVGIHEWLNWSPIDADGAYIWPPYRTEKEWLSGARPLSDWPSGDEFIRIGSMGFDFVRLSVDPGPLVASKGEKRRQALDILSRAVGRIVSGGLRVVFDLHGVSQVPATSMALVQGGADSEGVALYREMVKDVALMLAEIGTDKVAIEPYNEPAYYPCDSGGDDWQRIMANTVRDIRSVSASLTIVATGACGGDIKGLVNLSPDFDDPNIYYSFHMYEPHSFTHQRPDKAGGFLSGLPWPASAGTPEAVTGALQEQMEKAGLGDAEKRANMAEAHGVIATYFGKNWGKSQLEAGFRKALDWGKAHGIPSERLFMGEFGVILMSADGHSGAFDTDRLRYIAAVRELAERFHIPWSTWEYSNPHGMSVILPKGPAMPDGGLLKALGLLH